MIQRISGMIQTCQMHITAYVGDAKMDDIPIEVDGLYYPGHRGDDINPCEKERFEVSAVRININGEWSGWQLSDYSKLEAEIIDSIII